MVQNFSNYVEEVSVSIWLAIFDFRVTVDYHYNNNCFFVKTTI